MEAVIPFVVWIELTNHVRTGFGQMQVNIRSGEQEYFGTHWPGDALAFQLC